MLVGACSGGGGDAGGFCRRLDDLVGDLEEGTVSEEEFRDRISVETLGDPGGLLSTGRDRLERLVQAGDEMAAVEQTVDLQDLCAGLE